MFIKYNNNIISDFVNTRQRKNQYFPGFRNQRTFVKNAPTGKGSR